MDLFNATFLAVVIIAVLGLATAALVVVGIEGRYRDRHPVLADALARAARALNGDSQPPRGFQRIIR